MKTCVNRSFRVNTEVYHHGNLCYLYNGAIIQLMQITSFPAITVIYIIKIKMTQCHKIKVNYHTFQYLMWTSFYSVTCPLFQGMSRWKFALLHPKTTKWSWLNRNCTANQTILWVGKWICVSKNI